MITKIAYDVHTKQSLQSHILESVMPPQIVNDSSIISGAGYVPNSVLRSNGVLTSRGVIIYPVWDTTVYKRDSEIYVGTKYLTNDVRGSYKTLMYPDEEVTFDFFDPETDSFVPWTLYCRDVTYVESGVTKNGFELNWKDANGKHPPPIDPTRPNYYIDYIARSASRYTGNIANASLVVLLNFDGFSYNPFSVTDKVVARLSIQVQTRFDSSSKRRTTPKLNGMANRETMSWQSRCMPYQYPYCYAIPDVPYGYDTSNPTIAKYAAFGMGNWVKLHDNFKQYIYSGMTETLPDFEYQKYLEFSDL